MDDDTAARCTTCAAASAGIFMLLFSTLMQPTASHIWCLGAPIHGRKTTGHGGGLSWRSRSLGYQEPEPSRCLPTNMGDQEGQPWITHVLGVALIQFDPGLVFRFTFHTMIVLLLSLRVSVSIGHLCSIVSQPDELKNASCTEWPCTNVRTM
jgi:hypothetical protein